MIKTFKWIGWIVVGMLIIFIILLISIHTEPGKKLVRNRLQAYLSSKINTEVHIGTVDYLFPKWVEIDSVFIRDKAGDTLLCSNKIRVDMNMLQLLGSNYEISKIDFQSVIANVSRNANDTTFNYQFLIDAFAGKSTNTPAKKTVFSLSLNELNISTSYIRFNDQYGGVNASNNIGEMKLVNLVIKSPTNISLDKLDLNHSTLSLDKFLTQNNSSSKVSKDATTNDLMLLMKQVVLSNNSIAYNNLLEKKQAKGFDANHIKLDSLNADIGNIIYNSKNIKANAKSLSFIEQSGFVLNSLQGNLAIQDSIINVKDLLAKTPISSINANAKIYPASFADNYNGNAQNKIILNNNIIALKDVELLAPRVLDNYKKQLQGVSYLFANADITGNSKHLDIKNITIYSNKNDIYLNTAGTIDNALSKDNLRYNLSITKLTASKIFLESFVNVNGKQNVNLPASLTVSGKLNGNMIELNNDIVVSSNYGIAILKGQIKNFTKPDNLKYNMRLIAKSLEIGKWIHQDSLLGKMTGVIALQGSGVDYKTASVVSDIDLSSFRLKKHIYKSIRFKVDGKSGAFYVKGKIKDSLLMLNMDMHTSLNKKYPTVIGKLNIDNADLFKLGFYKTPLSLQTKADVQLKDLSPENLNAFLRLDSTIIYINKKAIRADSLFVKGIRDSGKTFISLLSPMMDAKINGDYKYDELNSLLQEYIAKYGQNKGIKNNAVASKINFDLGIEVKPNPMFALLLPGLLFDKKIQASGHFDNKLKDSSFTFNLTAPNVAYQSNHLANLQMKINGINDSVKYAIQLDTVRSSSLMLYTTSIAGGFSNNHLSADIVTNDENKKAKYGLTLNGTIENKLYKIHLEGKLKLNYANWIVDKQNVISYGSEGVNVSNFKLSKNTESIAINSSTAALNAPIDIKIDKFSLQNITGLLNRDSLEFGGMLNAQVKIDGLDKTVPLFSGNIKVDSLSYQNQLVGDVKIDAQNNKADAITFNGNLTGKGNNVDVKGTYNQSKIDAQIKLDPISFATIEPFTQHNLKHSSGNIKGNINVTGDVKNPEWNGNISFDNAYTQLAKYGTVLRINGQEIKLSYPTITLNQFTVKDSINNPVIIDGTIARKDGTFNTDLTVKATNFIVLDNTALSNESFYGKAITDIDVTITGTVLAPDVNGNISLKDKSQVTFVRVQNLASAKDREGVMEFVDIDTIRNRIYKPADLIVARSKKAPAALNYNLNIDIDKKALFNVIIDPLTRDELQLQGVGQLNAGVNPNGDISITGAYNLTKGSYQLNNKFLKRKFVLQEGSTIVLSGDPQNAEADITAVYEINVSPYDLVANEVADNTGSTNIYKQKIPFQVVLKIKGKLMKPTLEFDIQLKENSNGVNYDMSTTIENKLLQMRGDPSQMNKEVFALLVMGRFVGEQSKDFFAGSNSNGLKADQIVKESVSRFLSDAISEVASDLIRGLNVDINLRTIDDNRTVSKHTDLSFGLSKKFMDDRLNVTVGKSFTIDGEDPIAKGQNNDNVQFLPDITTTYKLSKDGRYMLKAYQKSGYETIIDGYFIETGVAFTLTMEFNKFKEIFSKKKN